MPKLSLKAYALITAFILLIAVIWLSVWCFRLSTELKSEKAARKVLETGLIQEIEVIQQQLGTFETNYNGLVDSDSDLKADVEDLRKTKADIKSKKDEDKNNAASYSAAAVKGYLSERYR